MTADGVITGMVAVAIAYLLGSFPTAYVITRQLTGKDIRRLGSGNVGANNTYHEVGPAAGIAVGIIDAGKGAAAIAIAHRLAEVPLLQANLFVLLAGLAVVAGQMWPVYLKFTGGNGLATTLGALAMLLPRELGIAFALVAVLWAITRNLILSTNISLASVPVSTWSLEKEWLYVGFLIILAVAMMLHFLPTARADLASAGTKADFLAGLLRRDRR